MEKINNIKLNKFYVRTRLDCLYGGNSMVNLSHIENLFVQLFDRVEAIEKQIKNQADEISLLERLYEALSKGKTDTAPRGNCRTSNIYGEERRGRPI